MNDWRAKLAELKKVVDEAEVAVEVEAKAVSEPAVPKRAKLNRGRGALPLLRPVPKRYRPRIEVEDDGPPVFNGRRSPMERW